MARLRLCSPFFLCISDLPQWIYDFVPTPREAGIALWPAFAVALTIMLTIFFVYLPRSVFLVVFLVAWRFALRHFICSFPYFKQLCQMGHRISMWDSTIAEVRPLHSVQGRSGLGALLTKYASALCLPVFFALLYSLSLYSCSQGLHEHRKCALCNVWCIAFVLLSH